MNKNLKHSKEKMHSASVMALRLGIIPKDLSLIAPDYFKYHLPHNLHMIVLLRNIIPEESIHFEIEKPNINFKIEGAKESILKIMAKREMKSKTIISSFVMDESPEEFVAIVVSNQIII